MRTDMGTGANSSSQKRRNPYSRHNGCCCTVSHANDVRAQRLATAGARTWTLKRLDGMSLAVASIFAISTLSLPANASPTCGMELACQQGSRDHGAGTDMRRHAGCHPVKACSSKRPTESSLNRGQP